MKENYRIILGLIALLILTLVILGYLSSYLNWYGYEKWKYRVGTSDINDSKRRGVFVKELHFKVDSFPRKIENFRVYIEKGFHYGHESEEETTPLLNSNYPYQVSFNFHPPPKFGILIDEPELRKFDSSNMAKGYLKSPNLKDTVVYYFAGDSVHSGRIKIWD